jgi:hypothetical protein
MKIRETPRINLKREHLLLIAVFFVFIFLRIFSDSPYYFIQGGDTARYLALADSFPYNTLFNNQLYIEHPPLYPYAIYFVSFLFEDHIAGLLVSLISLAIIFFIIYKLVMLVSNNYYIAFGTLILLSLSNVFINLSIGNLKRAPLGMMLTLLSIYYYIRFLKEGKTRNIIYSSLPALLLGITTDHAILLIPGLIITYVFFRDKTKIFHATIPIIAAIFSYSSWIFVRVYTYMTNEFYPVVNGTIVKTGDWGLRQLLSPQYFKEVESILPFGLSLDPSHYFYHVANMFKLVVAPLPMGLRFSNITMFLTSDNFLQLVIYPILGIATMYSLYKIIKLSLKKGIKNNEMLFFLTMFFLFLLPLTQIYTSPRFTVTAIPFLFIVTSYGLFKFAKTYNIFRIYKVGIIAIILILVLYLPFYYLNNNHFIFSKEKIVEIPITAQFINKLPKDGVMIQMGYVIELDYQSDKRIMALPVNADYFSLIDIYDVSYMVYGEQYHRPFSEGDKEGTLNYDAIKYIRDHPEQFKLLTIIEETYPTTEIKDHIYIYEVMLN